MKQKKQNQMWQEKRLWRTHLERRDIVGTEGTEGTRKSRDVHTPCLPQNAFFFAVKTHLEHETRPHSGPRLRKKPLGR